MKNFKKILFILILLFFNNYAFSHEIKFPYDYFKTQAIYQLNTGQIIYVEKTAHGQTLWEKNATGRLNKLGGFHGFFGIAKECHAYKEKEFENIVLGSHKEYFYGGGVDEFPIRIFHLYERDPHLAHGNVLGTLMNEEEAKSWCTFYEPISN